MSQPSYTRDHAIAYAGLQADSGFDCNVSRVAEGIVPFGIFAVAGTDAEEQVKVPTVDTDVVRGVSVAILNQTSGNYADTNVVTVKRKGAVWVSTDGGGITVDGPVYAVATSGVATDAAAGNIAIPNASYVKYDATTQLALVEINLP